MTRISSHSSDTATRLALVEVDDVHRSFDTVRAVDGVSFGVAAGEIVGLLGHNGAGKTTIVRLIAGLLEPDRGNITVAGRSPSTHGPLIRRHLGVLPSSPIVDVRLTGEQNLQFAARAFGMNHGSATERTRELLHRFGLTGRSADRVGTYSAGMRQRLALARVLLPDPDILLLDEPTAAMDPVGANEFIELLADFVADDRRRAVVLCTHDLAEAERLCHEVLVLNEGAVLASGTPAELASAVGALTEVLVDAASSDTALAVCRGFDADSEQRSDRIVLPTIRRELVPDLVRRLVGADVDICGVVARAPSLEEVYLHLHRPTDGVARPQAATS